MKQSSTSTSSAGIAVDSEESKAIADVTVIEERNVVNDVVAEDITLNHFIICVKRLIDRL